MPKFTYTPLKSIVPQHRAAFASQQEVCLEPGVNSQAILTAMENDHVQTSRQFQERMSGRRKCITKFEFCEPELSFNKISELERPLWLETFRSVRCNKGSFAADLCDVPGFYVPVVISSAQLCEDESWSKSSSHMWAVRFPVRFNKIRCI